MDKDLDEGIKGFQLSLEESEKVLLYNHVNGLSLLVSGRNALEFSCFWFSEYAVLYFSPRPHRLHWRNLKTQLISTVGPTFDTNPSRKRSFSKTPFKPEEFGNAGYLENRALRNTSPMIGDCCCF